MTLTSLAGLLAMNLLLLMAGTGVLWALRGWESWFEFGRLVGFAYFLGVAAGGVTCVWLLVIGSGLPVWQFLLVCLGFGAGGWIVGRRQGRRRPPLRSGEGRPQPFAAVAVVCGALVLLYLEVLFRRARLEGLWAWDSWSFWVPKAKAIYYFGGLDERLFTTLGGPSYPPLVPGLEAVAFRFMGSADTVTIHVQFWLFLVAFVAAVAGVLWNHVEAFIVWPMLALMVLAPDLNYRVISPQGDFLLDYFFVMAALALVLWVQRPERWRLVVAAIFLAAAMSTKREGMLLVACILAAAFLVTAPSLRRSWPPLLLVGAASFAATIPWRIWFGSRGIGGEGAEAGVSQLGGLSGRLWPSFKLVVDVFLSYDFWLFIGPIGLLAALVALLWGDRRTALLYLFTVVFAVFGFTWILWAVPSLPIRADQTPIPRVTGAIVLLSVAFVPLLLRSVWPAGEPVPPLVPRRTRARGSIRPRVLVLIALALALAYPVLPAARGGFDLPHRPACSRPPVPGEPAKVVFGYDRSFDVAVRLQQRALEVGFKGTEVTRADCGLLEVSLRGPTEANAGSVVEEARSAGLDAIVARDP